MVFLKMVNIDMHNIRFNNTEVETNYGGWAKVGIFHNIFSLNGRY